MFAVNLASERCAGFERSSIETSRLEKRKKENPSWFSVGLFFFSEIGSGAYGHHPLIGGGTPSSNPMRLLNWDPVSRKGGITAVQPAFEGLADGTRN
jgi:hypothetical protein